MNGLGWHKAMKYAALVALVGVVAVTTGGCASMAGNPATRSAGLADSELMRNHPPNANTVYGMARLLRSQNKNGKAEFVLLGLLRNHPTFSPTYNDLAEIRMSQNRFDEAIEYLEKGIAVVPNDAVLLNNAGVCAVLKRDYAGALVYFQRASMIAPYEARYRANVALAMGLNGEHEGSRALYGQIVSADDADFNANLIHGLAKPRVVEEVSHQAPVETTYQGAEVDMTQITSVVLPEEPEAVSIEAPSTKAVAAPAAMDETKSAEVVQPEEAVAPVALAEIVETSSTEAAQAVVSLTNSDVEAHSAEIRTVGLTPEAVEAEPAPAEQTFEASDAGESEAWTAFETETADAGTGPEAIEPDAAPVDFAIEEGEPAVGDELAYVLEAVEPETAQLIPETTVQEPEWVYGEFLLEETAPEDHVAPSSDVDATEADAQIIELAEADMLVRLGVDPADEVMEMNRVDESTD